MKVFYFSSLPEELKDYFFEAFDVELVRGHYYDFLCDNHPIRSKSGYMISNWLLQNDVKNREWVLFQY